MGKPAITQSRLKELLYYSEQFGIFVWKKSRGTVSAGSIAGSLDHHGYIQIKVDGRAYLAHRLAFLYMDGHFPADDTDHIKGIKTDNRWPKLRAVSHADNGRNQKRPTTNTSGFIGISWHKLANKWQAYIKISGRVKHLGLFNDISSAVKARTEAEIKYGFHKNHGREK